MIAGVAVMVRDKYAVRLVPEQREELQHLIRVGKSSARVTARARILLKSDDRGKAHLVALARSPAPEGHERWTLRPAGREGGGVGVGVIHVPRGSA